jgi:hypothetical protein
MAEEPQHKRATGDQPNAGVILRKPKWDLARSLLAFVADGCTTVSADQYRERLQICDSCEQRKGNRCRQCGCRLSIKARGRAFTCPNEKWPML